MRRKTITVLLVLLAVVGAPIAAAATGAVVPAVVHDEEADFTAAEELTQFGVEGDSVVFTRTEQGGNQTIDSFEDGDISEYTGDTSSFDVVSTDSTDGSQSLETTAGSTVEVLSTSGLNYYPEAGDTFQFDIKHTVQGTGITRTMFAVQDTDNYYSIDLNDNENSIELKKNSGGSISTIASDSYTPSADEWHTFRVDWGSDGSFTVTLYDSTGSEVSSFSGTDTTYTSGGIGALHFNGADSETVRWDNFKTVDAGELKDGVYVSSNMSAERTVGGSMNIVDASGADVTVTWEGWDGSSWVTLDESTRSAQTGERSASWSEFGGDKVRLNVTVDPTTDTTTYEFDSYETEFQSAAPEMSNLDPDGVETDESTVTLSADIADQDFDTVQGDEVDVTFFVDGQQVAARTVGSNQTVEVDAAGLPDGSHDWYVESTDEYGNTETSATQSLTVNNYEPLLDNGSAAPSGGEVVSGNSIEMSIDLEDADFGTNTGDTVTVDFYIDGSLVDSVEATSNGTVSVSQYADTGPHEWHARATDSHDNVVTSDTFEFSADLSYEPIYQDSEPADQDGWMDGKSDPTFSNMSTMVSRVSTFVVGGDASTNPLFTSVIIGLVVAAMVGFTGAGLVVGGTMAVITSMVLAIMGVAGAWVSTLVLVLVGMLLTVVYWRLRR